VSRASLLTNEESRAVRMKFSNSGQQLQLSSRAAEMGEADIRCDIAKFEGDDIEIGFNPHYIVDALKVIPENEVIIELKAANKPGLVKAGADFVYVVMPLNLT
jgi:DNA polymerase-3 subunit beta